MKLSYSIFLFALCLFANVSMAHGPTPKKVDQTLEMNASADQVWAQLQDFDRIADWHPLVIESSGDGQNKAGSSQRTLTLDKGSLIEGLNSYDPSKYKIGYQLDKDNVEALPVSSYRVKIQVQSVRKNKSSVHWTGRFYRGDTGNFPVETLNDDAAIKAMDAFIEAGLKGLKDKVEAGQS